MSADHSNRLTVVPSAADINNVDGLLKNSTSTSNKAGSPKKRPPKLPLTAKIVDPHSRLKKASPFLLNENPWRRYWGVWEKDQAGTGILAYENVKSFPVVFITEREPPKLKVQLLRLKEISHANIVHLKQAYLSDKSIFFVYESMQASLAQLEGTPYVSFNEADIATVCKELLQGLKHIHDDLRIAHGSLNCDNVLIAGDGTVQIANIGDSLLDGGDPDRKQRDMKDVGLIAVRLKERGTSLDNPETLTLREPENASAEVKDFIQRSSAVPSHTLLQHEFLLKSPGPWCLKPYLLEAEPYIYEHRRHIENNVH
ncbi:serine/threonine protein kinase [Polytolypa hystricis UAMH7299]|uniref:Serine/threonine protein kinase n=1 Tax=Polytolypa hystricis (strain UAMH7299) TaxID=1447883 RepID=A0A2B7YDC8_POLH7|nr:serine/threonine protein kinase [Polytolypa hystricis UAMH7299]